MAEKLCATGVRSRPGCGFGDPANLLMTSSGRDEAPWLLPNPDGGELVPPTSTVNRSHHDVVSPSGKSIPRSFRRLACTGIHVRRLGGPSPNGRPFLDDGRPDLDGREG